MLVVYILTGVVIGSTLFAGLYYILKLGEVI